MDGWMDGREGGREDVCVPDLLLLGLRNKYVKRQMNEWTDRKVDAQSDAPGRGRGRKIFGGGGGVRFSLWGLTSKKNP